MTAVSGTRKKIDFIFFHRVAGNLFFAVMLIYSIVYAVERICYVDSAWLSFERINGEKFSFPGDRYGAFFSEILLFIATKLHLPLKVLVYVFSTSYILLYYFVWRICAFKLKNHAAALVVIFGMIMGIRETFLHTVSETHQCIAYSALLYAILCYDFGTQTALKKILSALVALLVLFTHPMGIFTCAFALGYYFIRERNFRDTVVWIVAGLIVCVVLLNILHPPNVYDEAQYDRLASSTNSDSLLNSGALNFLLIHFNHFYWLPELAGLLTITWFAVRKEWLRMVLTTAGAIGYTIIACLTFSNGDSSIMIERIFLPTFFMINLALADLLFRENRIPKWIPMIVVLFFIVNGIRYINAGCLMYKKRVAYLDELVQKAIAQGNDKYILSDAAADKDKILVPWALGTETLIYSTLKYNKSVTVTLEPEGCDKTSVRLTKATCLPVTELNPHYFSLSSNEYQLLQ